LNKSVPLSTKGAALTIHLNVLNALNHPVWSTGPQLNNNGIGLNFLQDASITSTNFGQVSRPLNGARRIVIRAEIKF
jgi:hypothetical protein